jgi:N,N-dimethyl phenylurea N-demethylase beta subunit
MPDDLNTSVSIEIWQARAAQFLALEAKLLDERRFDEWHDMLAEDLSYEVPIRMAIERGKGEEFVEGAHRIHDNKEMVRMRIDRLSSGQAWSENPPSRTVRVVGSVLVAGPPQGAVLDVSSALLLYRQRAAEREWDLIAARRDDRLRITAAGLSLLNRRVLLVETIVSTPNLGVFL